VEFRLLGPVEVWDAGRPVPAGAPRQRTVLAALLVDAGRVVPATTLIDRVWDERPPSDARATLNAYLSRIRALLDMDLRGEGRGRRRLVHRSGGYVLDVDPDQVDVLRLRGLANEAARAHESPDRRVGLLREAIALWRGQPLAGLSGAWVARTRRVWQQQRLDLVAAWADAELRTGNPGTVIGALIDLTGEYPLVEPLAAVLMRALHAAGRTADALDVYTTTRQRLADELGADPGAELREVHRQVLRGLPEAAAPGSAPAVEGPAAAVPRQLPAAVPGFIGRAAELERLNGLLDAGPLDGGVSSAVIVGTPGVGKTTTAVYWAHRVADRFPDGQLYVNLRGFDPGNDALDPAAAVRGVLATLGVEPTRIPADLESQTAMYRTWLAGKRMLILLDNARDTAQVRPLLPGEPGCLVLVTSRNQLTGLIATDGAQSITLDLFTEQEATKLLTRRLGPDRVGAEPDAVAEIVARCARLPLALSLVAARAAIRTQVHLSVVAAELQDTQRRWEALSSDHPAGDMRAVLSWSYRTLAPGTAALFRLLGLHPGPDLSVPAAASLTGTAPDQVRRELTELTTANLLVEHSPDRYAFHDLLRDYAHDLARDTDSDEYRRDATYRLLDHYLHTAQAAATLLFPTQERLALGDATAGVTVHQFTDRDQAQQWYAAEHPALLTAVSHAAANGFDTHAWQLAATLLNILDTAGHWHELTAIQQTGVDSARRSADLPTQARAHRYLAVAHFRLRRFDDAYVHLQRSLDLLGRSGDQAGQVQTHLILSAVRGRQNHHREALTHSWRAHDLAKAIGDRRGQADALNNIGWYHSLLGEHQQALAYCRQALAIHQESGDRHRQATAWDSLGRVHHHLGHHTEAIACYQEAVNRLRELGDRPQEAESLRYAGDVHHAAGNLDAARDCWRQALAILEDIGHPDVHDVRTKLHAIRD
jgi:DNA-binding SARP family transcriptional activator/tetratricopeptide (TPR) repeat protein